MSRLSPIEREVLDSVINDYESPSTIVSEVSSAIGRSVSQSEVAATLANLAALGLAQAYVFDQRLSNYQPVSVAQAPVDVELWFLATAAGRATNDSAAG